MQIVGTYITHLQILSDPYGQIPGNSLKCLYTDTPASSSASALPAFPVQTGYYTPQQQQYMAQYGRPPPPGYGASPNMLQRAPVRSSSHIIFSDAGAILRFLPALP